MNTAKPLLFMALAMMALNVTPSIAHAADHMMMKNDKMMMMDHKNMNHENMTMNQTAYSDEMFDQMVKEKANFVVAFHKKGCPACAEQQKSLDALYKDAAYKDLKVLVVDFDNDTASLKKFKVGQQSTLISYKNGVEVAREAVTSADGIKSLLKK